MIIFKLRFLTFNFINFFSSLNLSLNWSLLYKMKLTEINATTSKAKNTITENLFRRINNYAPQKGCGVMP